MHQTRYRVRPEKRYADIPPMWCVYAEHNGKRALHPHIITRTLPGALHLLRIRLWRYKGNDVR